MLPQSLVTLAYIAAGLLFIFSLSGLSAQESARRGNLLGMIGMALAVVATALGPQVTQLRVHRRSPWRWAASSAPCVAAKVVMTAMPQLVAILHSFVGAAAVLVGFASYLDPSVHLTGTEARIHEVEIFVGVFVGALTFTGSVVAFGKLQGVIRSQAAAAAGPAPVQPGHRLGLRRHGHRASWAPDRASALDPLVIQTVLASLLGIHLVMAIGGADMPVVVSMLNSYSGWAAAAAGFMLSNDLLIITGALVGSSGAILSYIMCRAMNRSFWSVIFGGFGAEEGAAPGQGRRARPARSRASAPPRPRSSCATPAG